MEAYLDQIMQRHQNHSTFARAAIDADQAPAALLELLEIRELPTILVIDDGTVAARLEGRSSVTAIQLALQPWLR